MSLCRLHLKKLIHQAANHGWPLGLSKQCFLVANPQPWITMDCVRKGPLVASIRLYSTTSEEPSAPPIKKKKENPNARRVIANVGRFIPHNFIQVISENGEDLGRMNRREVIKIMEEHNLKLVLLRENTDPPVYKLMTGKQLFEEQSKLREKQKLNSSPGVTQIKEMSFLASISQHDLEVKIKQVFHWIEKKHHVRMTVLNSRSSEGPDKEVVLQQVLTSMQEHATCSVNPKARKDGRAVICVLRPLSDKELQKQKKNLEQENHEEQSTAQRTNRDQNQDSAPPNP
ncbi:translation initiation factor IF-3, mitochondrial [Gastrophryne carolinensis]